jgi:ribonuclease D
VIDNETRLAEFLPQLKSSEWIALDTEADSLHAYPEKLCLIQISIVPGDFLIDPLAGVDLWPLLKALKHRELILHGADYDLRLLFRGYHFVPEKVFDTMWAARLLGHKEFGLTHLVAKYLGVSLEKGPQKMDWARRPLTQRMENYARNDTRFLKPLADILRQALIEKGRLSWLEEVCTRVISESAQPKVQNPDEVWRIKGSDRLDRLGMAILRELWKWREQEAVTANKPPYFIFSHEALVHLASGLAKSKPMQHLIPSHVSPSRRARLSEAVHRALALPPSEHPHSRKSQPLRLTRAEQVRFQELKTHRDHKAQSLDLDPTLIGSKANLIALARDWETSKNDMMRWQRELLEADS